MRQSIALLSALAVVLPAAAAPLGSSEKVLLPNTIGEAGGRFQVDEIQTVLNVKPYAESFEAKAVLRCTGTKGNVKLAAFIFNGGRRCTDVTDNGRPLSFTHVGDFVVVKMVPPLAAGAERQLTMRYTGKAHCVSSQWIRDYTIDKFEVALRLLPQTGNMAATANLTLTGTGNYLDDRVKPSLPPHIKPIKHWVPPELAQRKVPKLGLVLNDNYVIDMVSLEGKTQDYTHSRGMLLVPLAEKMAKGKQVPVIIAYNGKIRNSERNRIWDNFDNDPMPSNPVGAE